MEKSQKFMRIAIEEAQNSGNDVPVGAVIVIDNKVIAKASNKREAINKPSAHAEMIVIDEAAQIIKNWRLNDAILYVTLEPCPMCAALILQSKIKTVVFGAYDANYGAFGSKIDMREIINSKTEVRGGIMENECQELILNFFKGKR